MSAPIHLKRTLSQDPDFKTLIQALDQNLTGIYGELQLSYDAHNIIQPGQSVVIAYQGQVPVGCGCFKPFDEQSVEIKRMYVAAPARGQGIAARILSELETWAASAGKKYAYLEKGRKQPEADALYQKFGYVQVANYAPYIDMQESICMRKSLAATIKPD